MAESGANARIIEIPRYSKMFREEQMNLRGRKKSCVYGK